jgi:hypothetical protein
MAFAAYNTVEWSVQAYYHLEALMIVNVHRGMTRYKRDYIIRVYMMHNLRLPVFNATTNVERSQLKEKIRKKICEVR